MFELDRELEAWKQNLVGNDAVNDSQALELEAHLLDQIAELKRAGLSNREAFLVGVDRLGHPSDLQREFEKVNGSLRLRNRALWMLAGYLAVTLFGAVISAFVAVAATGMAVAGVAGNVTGMVLVLLMAIGWIGLPVLAYRRFQVVGNAVDNLSLKWIWGAGIIFVGSPIVVAAGRVAQLRVADMSWVGASSVYLALGGFVVDFVLVAACLIAMVGFRQSTIKAAD